MSHSSLRKANPAYKGKNAYLDISLQDVPLESVPQGAAVKPADKLKKAKTIRDAVDIHRSVEDMLQIKGSYFPG